MYGGAIIWLIRPVAIAVSFEVSEILACGLPLYNTAVHSVALQSLWIDQQCSPNIVHPELLDQKREKTCQRVQLFGSYLYTLVLCSEFRTKATAPFSTRTSGNRTWRQTNKERVLCRNQVLKMAYKDAFCVRKK